MRGVLRKFVHGCILCFAKIGCWMLDAGWGRYWMPDGRYLMLDAGWGRYWMLDGRYRILDGVGIGC
jgi:hypothetical protein